MTLLAHERRALDAYTIYRDTREQCPLVFDKRVVPYVEDRKLPTGDYSIGIEGHDFTPGNPHAIAIERKRIGELIANLIYERERMIREFERARELDYFAVVIEGSYTQIVGHDYVMKVSPYEYRRNLFTLINRYRFPVFFSGGSTKPINGRSASAPFYAAMVVKDLLYAHVYNLIREGKVRISK